MSLRNFTCGTWWNSDATRLSQRLLFLHSFQDTNWSNWNGYSNCIQSGLAFKTNWKQPTIGTVIPKEFWVSHSTKWQRTSESELQKRASSAKEKNKGQTKDYKVELNVQPDTTMKCQKHLIVKDTNQIQLFKRWFGVYRWTYNKCCDLWNQKVIKNIPSSKEIRSLIVNTETIKEKYPNDWKWILEVPYDIRDKAALEFVKNIKTQIVSLGKSRDSFMMKFKTKRVSQSLEIDVKHWHDGCPFPSSWNKQKLSRIEFWKDRQLTRYSLLKPKHAVRLLSDTKSNTYYIATPTTVEVGDFKVNTQTNRDYCAIFFDPGVRTFLTGFDTKCRVVEFGVGYDSMLKGCKLLDKKISSSHRRKEEFVSETTRTRLKHKRKRQRKKERYKKNPMGPTAPTPTTHKVRYRMRRRVLPRIRRRLKNKVNDLHWKCAKFICRNYTDIHLPLFEVSRMTKKSPVRQLNSKTARMMCNWSHYRFQNILKYRCVTSGCRFYIPDEAFTSRTCCKCGNLKPKSKDKISYCPRCNLTIDRDINGAVNICIKQCC